MALDMLRELMIDTDERTKKKKKNLRKNNKKMICSSRKTSHRQTLEG